MKKKNFEKSTKKNEEIQIQKNVEVQLKIVLLLNIARRNGFYIDILKLQGTVEWIDLYFL